MCADTVKNIAGIFKRISLTELAAGNKTIDRGGSFSTGVTSGEKPLSAPYGNDPEDMFGKMIVIDVETAIFGVSIQRDPLSASITYCLANRPVFQATTNVIQNRSAMFPLKKNNPG